MDDITVNHADSGSFQLCSNGVADCNHIFTGICRAVIEAAVKIVSDIWLKCFSCVRVHN